MENFEMSPALAGNIVFSAVILIIAAAGIMILKRGVTLAAKYLNMPMLATRPLLLVIRYAILLIAIGLIFRRFGFGDMDAVLKVIGTILGLIAIGFVATWSILCNFLCTFVLIMFKPFSIGDELEIPGESVAGKVVDITLIFTVLRNPSGEDIQIPNNLFFQKIFKRRAGHHAIDLGEQLRQDNPVE